MPVDPDSGDVNWAMVVEPASPESKLARSTAAAAGTYFGCIGDAITPDIVYDQVKKKYVAYTAPSIATALGRHNRTCYRTKGKGTVTTMDGTLNAGGPDSTAVWLC